MYAISKGNRTTQTYEITILEELIKHVLQPQNIQSVWMLYYYSAVVCPIRDTVNIGNLKSRKRQHDDQYTPYRPTVCVLLTVIIIIIIIIIVIIITR